MHDSNETPTDLNPLMFSGLGNKTKHQWNICTRKYRCVFIWNCVPNLCRTEDILHVICRSQVVDTIVHTTSGFELSLVICSVFVICAVFVILYSPVIFRQSHESFSVNSKRSRNGSKKSGLGGTFTPPSNSNTKINKY